MNKPSIETVQHRFAGVFLITEGGRIVGQQRDDKPGIDNPGKIGPFGGTLEPGEEPVEAVWRELVEEETNLEIAKERITPFIEDVAWRKLTNEWEARYYFYCPIENSALATLEVYEGQGWAYISGPDDPNTIENLRPVLARLQQEL